MTFIIARFCSFYNRFLSGISRPFPYLEVRCQLQVSFCTLTIHDLPSPEKFQCRSGTKPVFFTSAALIASVRAFVISVRAFVVVFFLSLYSFLSDAYMKFCGIIIGRLLLEKADGRRQEPPARRGGWVMGGRGALLWGVGYSWRCILSLKSPPQMRYMLRRLACPSQ